ncbi:UNVERIFIED_CONTAM: hypothetical protein FKN15_060219 [Acipenser sinensis]
MASPHNRGTEEARGWTLISGLISGHGILHGGCRGRSRGAYAAINLGMRRRAAQRSTGTQTRLCSEPKWMENEHPQPKRGHWDSFFDLVGTMSWCPSCGEGGHSVINCPRPGEEEEGRPEGSWEAYLNANGSEGLRRD